MRRMATTGGKAHISAKASGGVEMFGGDAEADAGGGTEAGGGTGEVGSARACEV